MTRLSTLVPLLIACEAPPASAPVLRMEPTAAGRHEITGTAEPGEQPPMPPPAKSVQAALVRVHMRQADIGAKPHVVPPEPRLLLRGARDLLPALAACRNELPFAPESRWLTIEWTIAADGSSKEVRLSDGLAENLGGCAKTAAEGAKFTPLAKRADVRFTAWFGFDTTRNPDAEPLGNGEVLLLDRDGACYAMEPEECPAHKSCMPPPRRPIDCPTEAGAAPPLERARGLRVLTLTTSTGTDARSKAAALIDDGAMCGVELLGSYPIAGGRRQTYESEDIPCVTFDRLWAQASKSFPKSSDTRVSPDAARFAVTIEQRTRPDAPFTSRTTEGALAGATAFDALLRCGTPDTSLPWLGCTSATQPPAQD